MKTVIFTALTMANIYMGDKLFNVTFTGFMRSQIVIRDF